MIKKNLITLKKTLPQIMERAKNTTNSLVMYFDESRFGTHSNIGHSWFKKGSRTRVKVKLGFKNFYLYSSINPENGEHFSLLIPYVNTDWFNAYLHELSIKYKESSIILIIDGAGWHKSKALKIPNNIELELLPPYCPELNPVERFWQYIKNNTIKNRCYESLSELEDAICNFVTKIDNKIIKNICVDG